MDSISSLPENRSYTPSESLPEAPREASARLGSTTASDRSIPQHDQVSNSALEQMSGAAANPVHFASWAADAPAPAASRPPDYFAFSSKPISPQEVRSLVRQHGNNVMIGIDPTYEGSDRTLAAARQAGARLHIYLEGPGGPTGDNGEWDDSEFRRIQQAARQQGINIARPSDSDPGMRQWNASGWSRHALSQLREAKRQGFESAELDNLYRGLGDSPQRLVEFYQKYAYNYGQGEVPKLLLKNVDRAQMQAVSAAIRDGRLPRDMFADFHIWETSAGPLNGQENLARQLGIRTLLSTDTYRYRAQGAY